MANADEKIFLWINSGVGKFPLFDELVQYIVSDYLVPVVVLMSAVALWFVGKDAAERMRNQLRVFVALSSMGLSSLAVYIIAALYFRPRPFDGLDVNMLFYPPTDSSFPSNPVAATFAIAVGIWMINRRLGSLLMVVVWLYAFSRVYAGVHYPSDVVSAALIAITVSFLVSKAEKLVRPILVAVLRAARILCLA